MPSRCRSCALCYRGLTCLRRVGVVSFAQLLAVTRSQFGGGVTPYAVCPLCSPPSVSVSRQSLSLIISCPRHCRVRLQPRLPGVGGPGRPALTVPQRPQSPTSLAARSGGLTWQRLFVPSRSPHTKPFLPLRYPQHGASRAFSRRLRPRLTPLTRRRLASTFPPPPSSTGSSCSEGGGLLLAASARRSTRSRAGARSTTRHLR